MKAIKLIALFALLLGIAYAAFNIDFSPKPPKGIELDENMIKSYKDKFVKDWEESSDWDEEIFKKHCFTIETALSEYNTKDLKEWDVNRAIEKIDSLIFKEWSKSDCNKGKIDKYIKATDRIKREMEDPDKKNNSSLNKIARVNNLYNKAFNLANKKIGLTTGFNGDSWNSYSKYEQGIKATKNKIKGDNNFQYLQNIEDIQNGLNSIDNKLKNGRNKFYTTLADQICSHYRDVPKTNDNLTKLSGVIGKYNKEYKEYRENNKLQKLVTDFTEQVIANSTNQ